MCLALGFPDVDVLLDSISTRKLYEWAAFYKLEPFGEFRADLRAALIACTIANVSRDKKKQRKPFDIKDFLLFLDDAPVGSGSGAVAAKDPKATGVPFDDSQHPLYQKMMALNAQFGGEVENKRDGD